MRVPRNTSAADVRTIEEQEVTDLDDRWVDQQMVTDAGRLRRRASSLRTRADAMDGPLSISYRRRASELMLQAWVLEIRSGLPFTDIAAAA